MIHQLLFCIACTFLGLSHDIHISRTVIDVDRDADRLEVTCHLFLDDLELALSDSGELKLFTQQESAVADSVIAQYIGKHLLLVAGTDTVSWSYIGKEPTASMDAGYFYLESDLPASLDSCVLSATMLFEIYEDQRSICSVRSSGTRVHDVTFDRRYSFIAFSVEE